MEYEDVVRVIIEAEAAVVGDLAWQRADNLSFIDIEDHSISFNRALGPDDVEAVVGVFKEIQGKGAIGIARQALTGELSAGHTLDLPPEIVPVSVKEQDFVSGL